MEETGPPPLGYILLNLGVISFLLGLVGIWIRMPSIGLPTKRRAYVWVAFGVLLMAVGYPLMLLQE